MDVKRTGLLHAPHNRHLVKAPALPCPAMPCHAGSTVNNNHARSCNRMAVAPPSRTPPTSLIHPPPPPPPKPPPPPATPAFLLLSHRRHLIAPIREQEQHARQLPSALIFREHRTHAARTHESHPVLSRMYPQPDFVFTSCCCAPAVPRNPNPPRSHTGLPAPTRAPCLPASITALTSGRE